MIDEGSQEMKWARIGTDMNGTIGSIFTLNGWEADDDDNDEINK